MHSINKEAASSVYRWCYDTLENNGLLLLEVRTVNDPLYGQGKQVEKDAFFTDHYRRFVRKAELVTELEMLGFKIELAIESTGFARYKNEDPSVLRIIARKDVSK